MSKTDDLFRIAQDLANQWPRFYERLGPGHGDRATHAYMTELNARALRDFGQRYHQQQISGDNAMSVDFYFPDEATIVEVAMSLRNSNSEFERDVLKAIMAQEAGNPVTHIIFLSKPGVHARSQAPSSQAIIAWAQAAHGLTVEVREFGVVAETIIDTADE